MLVPFIGSMRGFALAIVNFSLSMPCVGVVAVFAVSGVGCVVVDGSSFLCLIPLR